MNFLKDIAVNLLSDGISFLLGATFIYLLSLIKKFLLSVSYDTFPFLKKSFLSKSTVKELLFGTFGTKKILHSNQLRTYKKNLILAG